MIFFIFSRVVVFRGIYFMKPLLCKPETSSRVLHNCLEFSQSLSCLYEAMQTRKRFLLLNYLSALVGSGFQ